MTPKDAFLSIVRSGPLWSAVISVAVYIALKRDPTIPKDAIDLYVGVVIALLGSLGITGVQAIKARAELLQAQRIGEGTARTLDANPIIKPDPAQVAYESYVTSLEGYVAMPAWRSLDARYRLAWNAAALAASRKS